MTSTARTSARPAALRASLLLAALSVLAPPSVLSATFPACAPRIFLSGFEGGTIFPWASSELPCGESEPNDDVSSTNPLCTAVDAALSPAGDHDAFRFTLEVPESIFYIEVNSSPGICGLDSQVTIRDQNGTQLAFDDDGGTGTCSYIVWVHDHTVAGPLYAVINEYQNNDAEDYYFEARIEMPIHTEVEPNDSQETATPYCTALDGAIHPAGDIDYVSFSATAGSTIVVETDAGAPSSCDVLDTVLHLFGPTGGAPVASDDNSGPGNCSRIELVADATGTWKAAVIDPGNDEEIANYRIVVTVTP